MRHPLRVLAIAGLLFGLAACRVGTNTKATTVPSTTPSGTIVAETTSTPTMIAATAAASPAATETTSTQTSSPATLVAHTDTECNPSPSQPWQGHASGPQEVQGSARSGEFWALVDGSMPMTANDGAKIIWKMSGDVGGNLQLIAADSAGNRLGPVWGPESHMGSNWARLGNEWGAGFVFPHAGCWDVRANSGNNVGDIWFDVVQPLKSSRATPTPESTVALYPVPATCAVTDLRAPSADKWGYTTGWWAGTDLKAASPSATLYASSSVYGQTIGGEFRWDLAQRAPLTISGHNLDQTDQKVQVITDLSSSLSEVYVTEITFPSPGCWQIHGEAGQQKLDFTVYVFPYGCLPANRRPPDSVGDCQSPNP